MKQDEYKGKAEGTGCSHVLWGEGGMFSSKNHPPSQLCSLGSKASKVHPLAASNLT